MVSGYLARLVVLESPRSDAPIRIFCGWPTDGVWERLLAQSDEMPSEETRQARVISGLVSHWNLDQPHDFETVASLPAELRESIYQAIMFDQRAVRGLLGRFRE